MLPIHSFSDAAQRLGFYPHVGSDVILRDALRNIGVFRKKDPVPKLGRIVIERAYLAYDIHKDILQGQPPEFLAVLYFFI